MMKTAMTLSLLVLATGLAGCTSMGAPRTMVRADPVCQDVTVPIYFGPNQSTLTRDGQRVINMAAADTHGCVVNSVQVLGLADAAGDPAANQELSQRRAATVSDALMQAKLPPAEFKVAAAGETGATARDGKAQPVRRRADVVLKLSKPK
jgi:outer membrane protein OmpA-like peptidoglycan-associated protein